MILHQTASRSSKTSTWSYGNFFCDSQPNIFNFSENDTKMSVFFQRSFQIFLIFGLKIFRVLSFHFTKAELKWFLITAQWVWIVYGFHRLISSSSPSFIRIKEIRIFCSLIIRDLITAFLLISLDDLDVSLPRLLSLIIINLPYK